MSARHLRSCLLAGLATAALLATGAAPAQAGLSSWSSLTGLTLGDGAQWVRVFETDTAPIVYAGTETDGIFRSVDNGVHWSPFSTGLPAIVNVRSITSVAGKVYAGTDQGLFVTSGSSWTPVAQGAEADPAHPKKLNQAVQALLSSGSSLLAGTASQGVFKSTDGGATWVPPAPGNGMPASTTVWDLTSIAGIVFAATTNGIYRSTNGGSSWTLSSDGLSGTVLHVIKADSDTTPNILYAATGDDGVYRSLNLGATWAPINDGPNGHDLGSETTHGIQQFQSASLTRLYVATYNGLYTGTTGNGPDPGPVTWRKVTDTGLTNGNVLWAVTSFTGLPNTLLVGTQSAGGYALTFQSPVSQTPPLVTGTVAAGQTLTGTAGTWSGTQTIDYDYQWQRCGSTLPSSCTTDIPGATSPTYLLSQSDDYNHYVRLEVTAHNDYPSLTDTPPKADSAVSAKVATASNLLPGYGQLGNPSITTPLSNPAVGDTLGVSIAPISGSGLTRTYRWLRCDANGDACQTIPGGVAATYLLVAADGSHTLRVQETATNQYGKATTDPSAPSNLIVPDPAKNVVAPKLYGSATVGSSLVGDVGTWASDQTTWDRQWERCDASGTGCGSIIGATGPGYVVTTQDIGQRLRLRVTADVNESYRLPAAVVVDTPLSAVVPKPGGGSVKPPPPKDTTKPVVQKLTAKSAKSSTALTVKLTEKSSLTVTITKSTKGHRVGKKCKSGTKKHAKACTITTTIGKLTPSAPAGTSKLTVGKKVGKKTLGKGSYRATIVPKDAAGNVGAAKTVSFTRK